MPTWTKEQLKQYQDRAKKNNPLPPMVTAVSLLAKLEMSTDEQKLNKTERAYLQYLRTGCGAAWIGIQNITLKLADDTRYTPDFFFIDCSGSELHAREVKGFWRDDAKVKIKVAARLFSWIRFTVAVKTKTGWEHTQVKP